MIEGKIQQLANLLIRPKRRTYKQIDLGPTKFNSQYCNCQRIDFDVQYFYGQTYGYQPTNLQFTYPKQHIPVLLKCSIFVPSFYKKTQLTQENTCVVCMHGNTGSRMSSIFSLQPVLKFGLAFAIFDFAGCGNSEGEYVTLGYYQKYQLSAVLHQIHNKFGYHKFILYGRSMGAASGLFYSSTVYNDYHHFRQKRLKDYCKKQLQKNQVEKFSHKEATNIIQKYYNGFFGYEVIGLIADSPYYSTNQAFTDLVNQRLWFVPKFLITYVMQIVENRANQTLKNAGLGKMPQSCINDQQQPKQQIIGGLSKGSDQEKKQIPILSIMNDVKIPAETHIAFPVYIIYGFNDDVISRKHTFQLFNKIQCDNKKLHVLLDEGHGNHRAEIMKESAIQWVLSWELTKNQNRRQDIKDILLQSGLQKSFHFNSKINCQIKIRQKQRQQTTQAVTEKTGSIGSVVFGQVQVQFGSSTSLDNFKKNIESPVSKQKKHNTTIKQYNQQEIDKVIGMQQIMQMIKLTYGRTMKLSSSIFPQNKLEQVDQHMLKNFNRSDEMLRQY